MLKILKISVWWVVQPVYVRQFYKLKIQIKITTLMQALLVSD